MSEWFMLTTPSGPSDSPYFEHPWMFSAYIPDVLVIDRLFLTMILNG